MLESILRIFTALLVILIGIIIALWVNNMDVEQRLPVRMLVIFNGIVIYGIITILNKYVKKSKEVEE